MLRVARGKQKHRRFLTYDLEWYPETMELRLVGVYDGKRYRSYRTCEEFLRGEMTSRNRGAWFYAHAGGLADAQYVLQALVQREDLEVTAAFAGSSAIIVKIKRGKNCWYLVDSYWLFRSSLRDIGRAIGMEKGGSEGGEEIFSAPLSELREYNEQDCKILWTAIDRFQDAMVALGGQLQMTAAATALMLFRRRFLREDVNTYSTLNELARGCYYASRVEVFQRECRNALYYDINSSFPHAMCQPAPGTYLGVRRQLPGSGIYFAHVRVQAPETWLPAVPLKRAGRIYFPTGTWTGWLTSVDVECLLENGGKVLRCYEAHAFEPFSDLADYARELYEKKKNASGPFDRMTYKLLLNSLYGKFAERSDKAKLYLHPSKITDSMDMYFPGAWIERSIVQVPHCHVAISAHITALARRNLFDHMKGERVHYCDTDGFSTESKHATGEGLGELKLEATIKRGYFHAPKLYQIDDKCRAKGFSLGKDPKIAMQRYLKLIRTGELEVERMLRIRELWSRGITQPTQAIVKKRLQKRVLEKRCMLKTGETRPWSADEIFEKVPSA